jgi:hypothetical protein
VLCLPLRVFQPQYLRWLVVPQFLLSCRPFCLVCCRIVRSKERLVLSPWDPVDSSSNLSLQRSSLVIEIAPNHYPLSTQHPRTRIPAFVRSLLPAHRIHRLRFPFFIECFGLSHTLSPPRASAACAAPMRGWRLCSRPRGVLSAGTVIASQAINSI